MIVKALALVLVQSLGQQLAYPDCAIRAGTRYDVPAHPVDGGFFLEAPRAYYDACRLATCEKELVSKAQNVTIEKKISSVSWFWVAVAAIVAGATGVVVGYTAAARR